jgi:DNA topoisomerase-1
VRFGGGAARVVGEHPEGGPVSVKDGRFGPYVNHGKINATVPRGTDPASLTLEEAVELLKAKAAGGGVVGRLIGEHPDGGPVTVRDGRYGAYVNWGKVNATIPKGTTPGSVMLSDALELIAEREGKPAVRPRRAAKATAGAKSAPAAKRTLAKASAQRANRGAKKKHTAKVAAAKPKSAASKTRG